MRTCLVCGEELPAQRGPRPRRYCSRACQAKAYRARQQQRDAHRLGASDEDRLLAQYEGVDALELADQLALAARRLAGALGAGHPADDFDLGVVARIPVVLAARAQWAAPAAQAARGIPDHQAGATATVIDLAARTPAARQDSPGGADIQASRDDSERGAPARPAARSAETSRDDSKPKPKGVEPRPRKLTQKKARAIVDAAELVRHPEHWDNHSWILWSGDTVLGYVEPTYGGASRSGRNGWTSRLDGATGQRRKSRDEAALDLAERWIRVVTSSR